MSILKKIFRLRASKRNKTVYVGNLLIDEDALRVKSSNVKEWYIKIDAAMNDFSRALLYKNLIRLVMVHKVTAHQIFFTVSGEKNKVCAIQNNLLSRNFKNIELEIDEEKLTSKNITQKDCEFSGFIEFNVAGTSFYVSDNDSWVEKILPGDSLVLHREPHNKYDSKAIEIFWIRRELRRKIKIGYVPRDKNLELSTLMDAGWGDIFETKVVEVDKRESDSPTVKAKVFVKKNEKH